MSLTSALRSLVAPTLKRSPPIWEAVRAADRAVERARHSAARMFPMVIRPKPRQLHVAITANCNQRCVGCRYGRDFMPGSQLAWPMVRDLLDDAKQCGFWEIRLYGGEPLLHPDLPRMVEHTVSLGMQPYVTTNAVLLQHKIDARFTRPGCATSTSASMASTRSTIPMFIGSAPSPASRRGSRRSVTATGWT